MITTLVKFPFQLVKCFVTIFVSVSPHYALIESSLTFVINESNNVIPPDEYRKVIWLKNLFPKSKFSHDSLSFKRENQIDILEIEKN
jgi:hypothetical protein